MTNNNNETYRKDRINDTELYKVSGGSGIEVAVEVSNGSAYPGQVFLPDTNALPRPQGGNLGDIKK